MSYYRTCPDCGANLDPQERCDCQDAPRPRYHVTVNLADGDIIESRWSGTLHEAIDHWTPGSARNVGEGPNDRYKRITAITIREIA